jgi:hypothetical protein
MEINKELTLEQKYGTLCQELGDIEVVLATYAGVKNNLLRQAGVLQREMQEAQKSNIKVVKDMGVIP